MLTTALVILVLGLVRQCLATEDLVPAATRRLGGHDHTLTPRAVYTTTLHPKARQPQATTNTLTPGTVQIEASSTSSGPSTSTPSPTPTELQPAKTPIPLAATMGLIMPDPYQMIYTGVNYTFGFVDPVPRPAPTIGGWLRLVQPLLVFPNYEVDVFPYTGAQSPHDGDAVPSGSGGLCGSTAEDFPIGYPFLFKEPGWYMFVINQTWLQPTIDSNNTCQLPLLAEKSFFSWQTLSVAPEPTISPHHPDPTSAYTQFASVTVETPPSLPYDKEPSTNTERLALGFGVTGGFLALVLIGVTVWWTRKRHQMKAETLAFSRLSEADKAAFLAENPTSFLNPNRDQLRRGRSQPPGPPGTMAYAQWYWQQMWERQRSNSRYGNPTMPHHAESRWQSWNPATGTEMPVYAYPYQGVVGGQMGQMGPMGPMGQPGMDQQQYHQAYKTY